MCSFDGSAACWTCHAETIMAGVEQGSDVVVMHNALLALRKLVKKFEYKVRASQEAVTQKPPSTLIRVILYVVDDYFCSSSDTPLRLVCAKQNRARRRGSRWTT